LFPKLAGDLERVDASLLPPGLLVADAMNRAVMRAAQRDGEFIASLAAERARLHESDVVRIRRLAAAQEARLLGHKSKMVPVAIAARRSHREHALIDALGLIGIGLIGSADLRVTSVGSFRRFAG
jgi:hypothetical protein